MEARLKAQAGDDEEKLKELLESNRITVSLAGRVMSRRLMGKAGFLDLRDKSGKLQSYVRRDDVGTDSFQDYKKGDIGDIIGIKGYLFRTKMGEVSVHAQQITLLSKSLLPLPEKWHGLTNTENRFEADAKFTNLV